MFGLIASPSLRCFDLVDCYAFFRSFVMTLTTSLVVIAQNTSLSAAQCVSFAVTRSAVPFLGGYNYVSEWGRHSPSTLPFSHAHSRTNASHNGELDIALDTLAETA